MANSDRESSIYDEAIEFQLEDEESNDIPRRAHSETPNEENVDVNDPDGLLPETLEARFERQIQVYEWRVPVSINRCDTWHVTFCKQSHRIY